ncbi:helix-turn-helix domain-containing protein [Glutamicibacter creatinolyticus]
MLVMRFLRLEDVAEELNVKLPQVRALVKSGELPAIQIGGRGMWRVERVELENYIQRRYAEAREDVARETK